VSAATPHLASDGHVVGFYGNDQVLLDQVAEYLIEGVTAGGPVLIMAAAAHCRELGEWLVVRGMDCESMSAAGAVRFVDAAETLSKVMVDGGPDADRFESVVGDLIDSSGSGRVRVYGEMAPLLFEAGQVNAAKQLERQWNDLAARRDFTLFCAYRPGTTGANPDVREELRQLHTAVVGYLPNTPDHAVHANNMATVELTPTADAPGTARRFVADTLLHWKWTGDHQAALLIVSELSANAVVHARSPFRVCVCRHDDVVRISVADHHRDGPVLVNPSPGKTSGRGLGIVAALADCWGHDIDARGKEVWAEIHSRRDRSVPADGSTAP
jgi:anti-sigma regulatory factor (Ser/Thr protein kinase)